MLHRFLFIAISMRTCQEFTDWRKKQPPGLWPWLPLLRSAVNGILVYTQSVAIHLRYPKRIQFQIEIIYIIIFKYMYIICNSFIQFIWLISNLDMQSRMKVSPSNTRSLRIRVIKKSGWKDLLSRSFRLWITLSCLQYNVTQHM